MRLLASLALLALFAPVALAQPKLPNLPPDLMAPTDPLSPEDERKQFAVPPGFSVQLVASEPDIQKPMQMAWDAKGRLWVTTSYHYPFAATDGKPSDKVFVLSDFDPNTGKAKTVRTFTADLNIPIGILPLPDMKSVLVSSVGEIRKYKISETKDGPKSDGFEVLFKGFGTRDTHGMYNSYTLMPDGWVYSCHGFANDSTVKDKSGNEVKMQSGHTFRFKPDGSKLEVWTRGQVNPFGMTVDPWFNLYTADCHSKPITQLIPGAYYDSFGKPHDGLGFAPHVTAHSHNSTGLCGLAWYDADHFPKDYLGTMFVGNVVTNRVNFDRIEWKGATPVAKELPDFMTSKDRWFRPVDIKLGPDGALYVADFYNKIIGHYEVDLKDPRRDKDRGRLWRVVWTGKDGNAPPAKFHREDFTKAKDDDLGNDLFHPNLTVRFLAGHQLRQRAIEGDKPDLTTVLLAATGKLDRASAVSGWFVAIEEADGKPHTVADIASFVSFAKDPKRGLKPEHLTGHLVRALAARPKWGADERAVLFDIRKDFNSVHQTRAMVEAIAAHPHGDFVPPLVGILKECAPDDTHLRHAARIALRNCLRTTDNWSSSDEPLVAEIALAIPGPKAAEYLLSRMKTKHVPAARLVAAAELVARYGTAREEKELFEFLTKDHTALDAIRAGFRGVQARGTKLNSETAVVLAESANRAISGSDVTTHTPYPDNKHIKMFMWGAEVFTAMAPVLDRADIGKRIGPGVGQTTLEHVVASERLPADVRATAAEVLLGYMPDQVFKVREQLKKGTTPEAARERFMLALIASGNRDARPDVVEALSTVPYRVAVPVGLALAATPSGADALLDAVRLGKAPARLLQEKAILERIKANNATDWEKRVNDLTKNLPAADQRIAGLLKTRAAGFVNAKPDKELGAKLFTKHCAACHRIGDAGGKIAPQLDGVGVRGAERLLEDVLDPNRNVDVAFRARSVTLTNEKTLTALMLRVEGEVVVFADLEGKEQRIPTKDIATNRETQLSAMPANFADVIPEADLYHLLAYLLDQKAKEK